MTDDTIRLKVDAIPECDGSEATVLVDENGYHVATLNEDAVKVHDFEVGQVFEMRLVKPWASATAGRDDK